MTTLEDLYYGNISPHERYIKRGTRVDKLVKLICKNEEELNAGLTEKQKETFEKFKDCTSELSCITEREAFSSGFILTTRIAVAIAQIVMKKAERRRVLPHLTKNQAILTKAKNSKEYPLAVSRCTMQPKIATELQS